MGRFLSPDPAGLTYANPYNPQTFNLYSYALNSPLKNTDPTGMECVWDDGSFNAADDPQTGSAEGCSGQGGTYVNPAEFQNAYLYNGSSWSSNYGDWSGSANSDLANSYGADQVGVTPPPPGTEPGYDLQVALFQLPGVLAYQGRYANWWINAKYNQFNTDPTVNNWLQSRAAMNFACYANPEGVMAINAMKNGQVFPSPSDGSDGDGATAIYLPNGGATKNGDRATFYRIRSYL